MMENTELVAIENRLRKTILKAGALAGVCAVVTVMAIALILGSIRWGWLQIQENAATKQAEIAANEDTKVSAEYMAEAQNAAALIRAEHMAAPKGQKAYDASQEKAKDALHQLETLEKSYHEITLTRALYQTEFEYSLCADGSLNAPELHGSVSKCEEQEPIANIDKALKQ
jgi:uncharacterized protein HemX